MQHGYRAFAVESRDTPHHGDSNIVLQVNGLRVLDLLRLVAADEEPQAHLRKLFEWQVERAMTAVRIMTAGVGATLVTLVAAVLKDGENRVTPAVLVIVIVASVLGLAYSWSRYQAASKLEREYVLALNLLRELSPLAPLLQLAPDLYVD